MHFADLSVTVLRQVSSRRSARESITKSRASDVRKSLKLPESVSTTDLYFATHGERDYKKSRKRLLFLYFSRYTVDISLYCDKLKKVKRIKGDSAITGGVSIFLEMALQRH